MTDDLLKAATRALREEGDGDADGRFTRARVMASLHQGKVKRRTRLAFILPIAACLAAGTAWGAATGKLPAVLRAISAAVSFEPKPAPTEKSKASAARKPAITAATPVPPPVPPPVAPVEAAAELPPAKAAPVTSVRPTPSARSSASFSDTDGDLYRLAHEAHFAAHDYARALPAWEAYLRAAPGGRLATEARYNRAICLLRLGRDDEARKALQPFSTGMIGYRQSEAQQLLKELGNPAETPDR